MRGVISGFGRIMRKGVKRTFVQKIRAAIADELLRAALIETSLLSIEAALEQWLAYVRTVMK